MYSRPMNKGHHDLPMKAPSHPGEMIDAALDKLGLPVAEAAKALGVSRQALYNLIAGRSGVTAEMALRLEKLLGRTAKTWLAMQLDYDLALAEIASREEAVEGSALRLHAARRAALRKRQVQRAARTA